MDDFKRFMNKVPGPAPGESGPGAQPPGKGAELSARANAPERGSVRSAAGGNEPAAGRDAGSWNGFRARLAQALGQLGEGQFLVVSAKREHRFVQFAGHGAPGLRAETVSNHYLEGKERLGRGQIRALGKAGWRSPTVSADPSVPEDDGSPNFFLDFGQPVDFPAVAKLAVRTLSRIHRIRAPSGLEYQAFERSGRAILLPGLGIDLEADDPAAGSVQEGGAEGQPPAEQLLAAVREATGLDDLAFDEDGQIGVWFKDLHIGIFQYGPPRWIRFVAALVTGVQSGKSLLGRLNAINAGFQPIRCFLYEDYMLAAADVPAEPFVKEQVIAALHEFSGEAKSMAILLRAEQQGRAGADWAEAGALRH